MIDYDMHSMRTRRHLIAAVILMNLYIAVPSSFCQEHTNRDYETAATKGAFYLETGDPVSARDQFKQALAVKPGDKEATIGLGISYARAGNFSDAKETLLKALAVDPRDARVRYELGVVMYKLGEMDEAKDFFSAAIEGSADAALISAARKYLDLVEKERGAGKNLSLSLLGGLQYDTNVILEPNNPVAAQPRRKTDWRAVLTLDGDYRFLKSETTAADAGYQFYQSVHRDLHDFNIQQHNLKLAITHDLSKTAKAGIKYTFGYTLAGGSRFSTSNETIPFVTISFTPASLTEFHYICEKGRFYNSALFPLNAQQSGTDRTGGVLHTVRLGATAGLSIGYDYDANDANERFWSYRGHKGSLSVQGTQGSYTASLSASYYDRRYRDVIAGYTEKRHDGVQEYSAGLSRNMGKDLSLAVSELYTVNDSNLSPYEYTRNILGLFMVTRI
jgi:tetratricopeptide (TPR) repeat protein